MVQFLRLKRIMIYSQDDTIDLEEIEIIASSFEDFIQYEYDIDDSEFE